MLQKTHMIISALDKNGIIVSAEKAVPGVTYFCAQCGVRLHITHRNGKKFFVCYANEPHTGLHCAKSHHKIKTPEDTDIDKLFLGILSPSKEKRPGTGGGGPREPRFGTTGFSTLSDFVDHGYHEHAPQDGMFGKYPVEQILITEYNAHTIKHDNRVLGQRIVCLKKDAYINEQRAIRFVLCQKGKNKQKHMFFLFFSSDRYEDYKRFREKLWFAKDSATIEHILIAGDWENVDLPSCKPICKKKCPGSWPCTGMQRTSFVKNSQLLIIYKKEDANKA